MNARDLSEPPITGRPRDAPLRRNITITEGLCTRNKGTTQNEAERAFLEGCCTNSTQPRMGFHPKCLFYLNFSDQRSLHHGMLPRCLVRRFCRLAPRFRDRIDRANEQAGTTRCPSVTAVPPQQVHIIYIDIYRHIGVMPPKALTVSSGRPSPRTIVDQQETPRAGRQTARRTRRIGAATPGFDGKDSSETGARAAVASCGSVMWHKVTCHKNGSRIQPRRICRLRHAPASGISAVTELWPSG
jgi:hypothetical protein